MSEPHTDFESEFNTHIRVPDHHAIVDQWGRAAEDYRSSANAELGLAYGEGPRNGLDLFWPQQDRHGPIVLFVHGGYWQSFDRSWFSHFAGGPNEHGIPVAIPSYPLCPHVKLDEITEDMRHCCAWLETHTGRSIVAVGHSSGGQIAAALLASDWSHLEGRGGHRLVRAAVTISGVFDLVPLVSTSINANLHLDEKHANDVSPVNWPAPSGTWLSAVIGWEESPEFIRQSQLIVDLWCEHGVHTDLTVIEGANHYATVAGLADPGSEVTEKVALLCHSLE